MAKKFKALAMFPASIMVWAMMTAVAAHAAWQPGHTVEIITGCKTGCSPDQIARMLQHIWMKYGLVKSKIVVVNKAGGGNSIAMNYLEQHKGDGNYLMLGGSAPISSYLTGRSPIGVDQLTSVALLTTEYISTAVRSDSPIKNAKDLMVRLKKDPKSLSIAVATTRGNANHQAIALAAMDAGINPDALKLVIFQSGRIGRTNLLGGHVDVAQASVSGFIKAYKEGKLRIIAIAAPKRLGGAAKDIPTWKEQGLDVVVTNLRSVLGPSGMSKEQIAFWDGVLAKTVKTKEFKKMASKRLMEITYMDHDEFLPYLHKQEDQVKKVLKALGILKRE